MIKRFNIVIVAVVLIFSSGCSTVKNLLSAKDAEDAIREMLSIGTMLSKKDAFSKATLIDALFPEDVRKVLNTLETLGLSKEVDRFATTLGTAAEQTAEKSVPVFLLGIKQMNFRDAVGIVKKGGTAATDYLRQNIGDTLRRSITPVMRTALQEYKLESEWNKLVAPVKLFAGDKLNLDLSNLMSGLVANVMFNKIAEKESAIRTKAEERTSATLQKVFGQVWKN
jgi:uncharacterized protein YceK